MNKGFKRFLTGVGVGTVAGVILYKKKKNRELNEYLSNLETHPNKEPLDDNEVEIHVYLEDEENNTSNAGVPNENTSTISTKNEVSDNDCLYRCISCDDRETCEKSREEIIKGWRRLTPDGSRLACSKDTGIGRNTVSRKWDC